MPRIFALFLVLPLFATPPSTPFPNLNHCSLDLGRSLDGSRQEALSIPPTARVGGSDSLRGGGPCSAADFAALGGSALVNALADASQACLDSLWQYNNDVATVIAPSNISLIATTITTEAADLSANATRLQRLIYVYQIAFYHAFYQDGVTYDAATENAARQAMVAVATSNDFMQEQSAIIDLRARWVISIDSVNGTHLVVDQVSQILQRFRDNPALVSTVQERNTVYYCLFSVQRQVSNHANDGASSPWYTLITTAFCDLIGDYALDTNYTDDTRFLVENALYTLASFSALTPATATAAHQKISTAYTVFPRYSGPWFRALLDLDDKFNGTLADGTVLDLASIREEVHQFALPHEYSFDQGRLVFKTAIPLADAEALYDALKEVAAAFFRKGTFTDPVTGDRNENLTLVVYGSPDDYQRFQPFLYGFNTNNGGIYIENMSTLFTYERTPAQSIYTLEELLRHEYVHYLDARYLVHGSFGDPGSLYDNNRLVWYSEGLAEFLVGSSRLQSVLPRGNLLEQVERDATRMTINDILYTTYDSGFTFYRYAGLLFTWFDEQRPDLLAELFTKIRADNAADVDAFYSSLAGDGALQTAYDQWLTAKIAAWQAGSEVFAEDVPTVPTPTGLPENNADALLQTLNQSVSASDTDFQVWSNRWAWRGRTSLTAQSPTPASAADQLETHLDQLLTSLGDGNFASATAWFGNLTIAGNQIEAETFLEGPYLATANDQDPPQIPQGLTVSCGIGSATLSWTENTEADFAGYHIWRAPQYGGPYTRLTTHAQRNATYADNSLPGGQTWYYAVTATDASGNVSARSDRVMATSLASILLVNGTNDDQRSLDEYRTVLNDASVGHDFWNPATDGEPDTALLSAYVDGLVIWACDYFSIDELDPTRQAAMIDYLEAGGNLLISGAYITNGLHGTTLLNDYLMVETVNFSPRYSRLNGVAGDPLGDNLDLDMTSVDYQSEINPRPGATTAFTYDQTSGSGTIQSSGTAIARVDNSFRVVFLAFPFRMVAYSSRAQLLDRVLDWVIPPGSGENCGAVDWPVGFASWRNSPLCQSTIARITDLVSYVNNDFQCPE